MAGVRRDASRVVRRRLEVAMEGRWPPAGGGEGAGSVDRARRGVRGRRRAEAVARRRADMGASSTGDLL